MASWKPRPIRPVRDEIRNRVSTLLEKLASTEDGAADGVARRGGPSGATGPAGWRRRLPAG